MSLGDKSRWNSYYFFVSGLLKGIIMAGVYQGQSGRPSGAILMECSLIPDIV